MTAPTEMHEKSPNLIKINPKMLNAKCKLVACKAKIWIASESQSASSWLVSRRLIRSIDWCWVGTMTERRAAAEY